jgi:hypothetical protein
MNEAGCKCVTGSDCVNDLYPMARVGINPGATEENASVLAACHAEEL